MYTHTSINDQKKKLYDFKLNTLEISQNKTSHCN